MSTGNQDKKKSKTTTPQITATKPIDWDYIKSFCERNLVKRIIDGTEHLLIRQDSSGKPIVNRMTHQNLNVTVAGWYRSLQTQSYPKAPSGSQWGSACAVSGCCSHSWIQTQKCTSIADFKHESDWIYAKEYLKHHSRVATATEQDPNPNLIGPCRIWMARVSDGCAMATVCGFTQSANRLAWEVRYEQILPKDEQIKHICRSKLCVNPEHITSSTLSRLERITSESKHIAPMVVASLWELPQKEGRDQVERLKALCDVVFRNPDEPCWIWKDEKAAKPRISFGKTNMGPKRFSYQLFIGKIPPEKSITSICGDARCCYWRHLQIGTMKDANGEKQKRGAQPKGEDHHASTMSNDVRAAVKRALSEGESNDEVAERFGVTTDAVKGIKRAKVSPSL